jgi:hypothetical protein
VASLKADENTILPDRFRQKDHERGISPEATPMTKGGSLAVSGKALARMSRSLPSETRVQPIRESAWRHR